MNKYFPSEKWEEEICTHTGEIKAISEYTGLNFTQVYDLPYPLFLLYRRDTTIHTLKQFDKGKEFLKTLWRLQQTEPDLEAIRRRGGERR
ncbi:hypothetical protein [Diplocloster agilis]|uniref:hypothetical protein n=1 Tax=Diplocloster agilis TaxID=2850323 RepID=UPI001EE7C679|nr:hypothetical protein [Diplocloster agilis]